MVKKQTSCNICGKEFEYYTTENRSGKFCSQDCYHESRRKRVEIECEVCGDSFEACPSEERTTCSKKCQYKYFEIAYEDKDERECVKCGSSFEVIASSKQKYCSTKCLGLSQEGRREKYKCSECGKEFKDLPSADRVYCSRECKYKSQRNKVNRTCNYCNKEYVTTPKDNLYYCSLECMGKDRRGSNHMNWKGGVSLSYGNNWWQNREKVLERDNYSCVICGKSKEETEDLLDVHHIVPLRKFDDMKKANRFDNLITLCRSHHLKVEGWGLIPSNADVELSG